VRERGRDSEIESTLRYGGKVEFYIGNPARTRSAARSGRDAEAERRREGITVELIRHSIQESTTEDKFLMK